MPTQYITRFLLAVTLFISLLAILALGQSLAQEPATGSPKGTEPTPGAPTTEPPTAAAPTVIDPALRLKIEPQLLKQILTSSDKSAPFIVYMTVQADTEAAAASVQSGTGLQKKPTALEKRQAIVKALQQTARSTQAGVLQVLTNATGPTIAATAVEPLWIVNAVAARGSLETVLALAARPDVEIVRLDKTIRIKRTTPGEVQTTQPGSPSLTPLAATPEWGVAKIRANLVHDALGITGAGVTVANIDTGVDWLHPALQTHYRGYTGPGKLPVHSGNWYDATGEGATYPVDTDGHGTHTMGTIAGSNGIGVAPGAQWIAVRAFNSSGLALNSWLHEAFQWVLAPNGNPALAPDIVNNSWGNSNGASTEFQSDLQALLNAGIFPVFSAGNTGSNSGTVNSPGSLDIVLAVGATDINDDIVYFSSRGPSPWGKIKPEVSAPGKDVRSAMPGGTYGTLSGTSMAAPHVSGLIALLLQANPSLNNNPNDIVNALTSTTVQLGSPVPNNNYGWGRIDAYNAVMSVSSIGTLQGTISSGGQPIANATLQIVPHTSGPTVNTTSADNGVYSLGLASGAYDVTASAFGYEAATQFGVTISDNTTTTVNFTLSAQPTGTLVGTVKDKVNPSLALAATVAVDGTPASATTNPANGAYSLNLPVGTYTLTAISADHRIGKVYSVTINDGATTTQNMLLDPAPSILLVDSGRWYQESQIGYYQEALSDALYTYDLWQITSVSGDSRNVPTTADLINYDLVIWSSPFDSPGYVGAGDAIGEYLEGGGRLLLSGQDIAYFDGGGYIASSNYLVAYLKAAFVADDAGTTTVAGVAGEPFAGLSLSIAGAGGADNQTSPDVITNLNSDFARSLLTYDGGDLAGLHIDLCLPYRAIFLPFGFEGINARADRQQVMTQSIDWLRQSQPNYGVELLPAAQTKVGNFGSTMSQTVRLRNTGVAPDTYNLSVSSGTPYNWTISGYPASVSLAGCELQEIAMDVSIPAAKTWHISDTFTVSAQSVGSGLTETVTRTTKTPAPVLLVDDDRWLSFADEFKEALQANQIPFDYWLVPKSWAGPVPPSPPLATLQMYPMTVWYTAYDWFQPLTPTEEDRLADYLNSGGRLFFSGQDYLYQHLLQHDGAYAPFVQDYLGIQTHTEDFTSTLIIGQSGSPVGTHLGPYNLTFPPGYKNWTDALEPTSSARAASRGQAGQINSLTNAGTGLNGAAWRTNFLAYGPELLEANDRARLMQRSLGWLSWLGNSTVTPTAEASLDGEQATYTAVIANDGWDNIATAYFTATFPVELTPQTASPGLTLSNGNFVWSGPLAKNETKTFTYTATISDHLPLGTIVAQTSWLAYPEHHILFDRVADLRVNFPSYNTSSFSVTPTVGAQAGDILNYTLVLKNDGLVDSPVVTATNTLPLMLDLQAYTPPGKGALSIQDRNFTWVLPLAKNETATLTYQAVISYQTSSAIENTVEVNDGLNSPLTLTARTTYKVLPMYFPLLLKNH
ncbi:MAG: S8 family serine peptidase [Anaerolineales bacterium]|nr:S8 family serine peptidase [Anaerolineales bacterium]